MGNCHRICIVTFLEDAAARDFILIEAKAGTWFLTGNDAGGSGDRSAACQYVPMTAVLHDP